MRGFDSCYPCLLNSQGSKIVPSLPTKIHAHATIKLAIVRPAHSTVSLQNPNFYYSRVPAQLLRSAYKHKITGGRLSLSRKSRLASKLAMSKVFYFKLAAVNGSPNRVTKLTGNNQHNHQTNLLSDVPLGSTLPHLQLRASNLYFAPKVKAVRLVSPDSLAADGLSTSSYSKASGSSSTWFNKTLIDAVSFLSGKKTLLQFYPFLSSSVSKYNAAVYKSWVPRLLFYQKRLGHRFFMEESLRIMHVALNLHDASLFAKWLKSLIKRISFWKTRSIFRYLVYLFNNFFSKELESIGCKGLRIRLKGKISAAGNSRKRSISLSFGKVSYSTLDIKCVSNDTPVSTFTGAMCLRTQIFY